MYSPFLEQFDKRIFRGAQIGMGVLTWGLLLSPIWLGLLFPKIIVYLLTFFTIFWFYTGMKTALGMSIGYARYKAEMEVEWYAECKKLDFEQLPDRHQLPSDLSQIRHIIQIPVYREPYEVLKPALDAIASQTFPISQIVLVFAIEERFYDKEFAAINEALGENSTKFNKILFYMHPAGIPGEAIGDAGANRAWGISHAVEDLTKAGENLDNYLFHNMDSDHVFDQQYIARATHLHLTSDKRLNRFYTTAVALFNNNIWRVPFMMRMEATSVMLGVLSDWSIDRPHLKKTFAAFSVPLRTVIDAGYFDVALAADDTIFFWKAFFARDGDFEGRCHYIPYSADAVEGATYLDSYKSLYKQLLRWGWGAIDFPISVTGFIQRKGIPLHRKIQWVMTQLKLRVVFINIVFLITFGFNIVTLVNPYVKQSNFAYSLPDLMSYILTFTLGFMIPAIYYRMKMVAPFPKTWGIVRRTLAYLESPLVIINMLTIGFFPWIQAQTAILFGKQMTKFYYTVKHR